MFETFNGFGGFGTNPPRTNGTAFSASTKSSYAASLVTTGSTIQQSGIYRCTCPSCRNEITCVKGDRCPPCRNCNNTTFRLVRATR